MYTDSYSNKVMEHFRHPKNMGKIKDPNGVGKVGNPVCGDTMFIYIRVEKDKKGKEVIKNIGFETMGCAAAIATSSMLTSLAKGKTLDEAQEIDKEYIAESLGGLPPIKMHCSNLASDGLKKAIDDYLSRQKQKKA